ncbi:MAG: MMPL family transporter [Gammaproteobacteria bacterium]
MIKLLYSSAIRYPKITILLILGVTIFLALQLPKLHWETDARVYLPKGHPAIKYDEKVDDVFGVKDAVIIGIVNDKKGIFNPATLARIARITQKIAALPGVIANRPIDVASLSTVSIFSGDESSIGSQRLMPHVPTDAAGIARLKKAVYANSDLLVGNLVSPDGKAAMIRAKLKEGINTRYRTYFEIKCQILPQETGDWSAMQECASAGGGDWQKNGKQGAAGRQQQKGAGQGDWRQNQASWGQWQHNANGGQAQGRALNGDRIYLAGRPVIEVTSGMQAIKDMRIMIPMLVAAIGLTLLLIFRTGRGVVLPLFVMGAAIVWTMGIMALLNVPLYTISTMLPVILVAVSIGDSVHLLSEYYDQVVHDAHRPGSELIAKAIRHLSRPLVTTSITTAVGFLSLSFAEMPPFIVFGLFTVLGISISWLLTVTFIPAALTILKPKVGGYLAKRRSLRVHSEQTRLVRWLVASGSLLHERRRLAGVILLGISAVALVGAARLYVDSSWMNDFRQDSELVKANKMLNDEFDGTIFMNVVVAGDKKDIFRSPELLKHVEALQNYVDKLPYVGGSRSIADYIKNMNKTLHAEDSNYDVIPDSAAQIGEYLYLFSVSGRPQQLDEMIDYGYRQALVTFAIKTDHTEALKKIIDETRAFADKEFAGGQVKVNFAGSANNSYVWAHLLIGSQTRSIVLSKLAILIIAILMFRSLRIGIIAVVPLIFSTLLVAGLAGFLGIPLDVSTALAAGVAIGVGVDYAVHYIFRYREELAGTGDKLAATQATMRSVGKTIVFNALVVIIGFLVLLISQFPPHIKLGYFVVSYMVVSCLAALTILPVLLGFSRAEVKSQAKVNGL